MDMHDYKLNYKGYTIVIKKDFGSGFYMDDGMPTNFGYVVTDGFCNVMPGACWFGTVREAKEGIDILVLSKKTGENFWAINDKVMKAKQAAIANILETP